MERIRSQKRQEYLLYGISGVSQCAISLANLALVYYLRYRFSLSAYVIGIASATYTGSYFLFCVVLQPLYARIKPQYCIEASAAGMAFAIMLTLLARQIWQVFCALVFYGFFMALLWPQIESWLSRGKEHADLNRATSAFNVSWTVGAAVSPLIVGILLTYSFVIPLIVSILLFFLVFLSLFLATLLVPTLRTVVSESQSVRKEEAEDHSTPLRFLCWAGVCTAYIALSVTLVIFPLYALDNLPFSEGTVGVLLFLRAMVTVVMFVVLGKTSLWHFNKAIVRLVQFLFAFVCLSGIFAESFFGYAVFFSLFGLLFACMYSFSIFHGASGSVQRTRRMMIHEALLTAGTIIGSSAGGALYEYWDFHAVLIACACTILAPLLIEALYSAYRQKKAIIF